MANSLGSDFSDVVSVSSSASVFDRPAVAGTAGSMSQMELDTTDRMYVVAEGDTLSSIARKFYGDAKSRRRILEANRAVIHDTYQIQPGWRLRIPSR